MQTIFGYIQLFDFTAQQLIFTFLIFIWSGWLPILCVHLLVFTALTLRTRLNNVDWGILKNTAIYILPGKVIGVFGLLSLPNRWLIVIIYGITLCYALLWVLNLRIQSEKGWTDKLLLAIGGYVSGTSLMGAPLMVAVYMHRINRESLRNTLFVLWFVLVVIKLGTLAAFDVALQFPSAIILIPVSGIGHFFGLRAHEYMLKNDMLFRRILGVILIGISVIGLMSLQRGQV